MSLRACLPPVYFCPTHCDILRLGNLTAFIPSLSRPSFPLHLYTPTPPLYSHSTEASAPHDRRSFTASAIIVRRVQAPHQTYTQKAGAATPRQNFAVGALAHERAHYGDTRKELAEAASLCGVCSPTNSWPVLQRGGMSVSLQGRNKHRVLIIHGWQGYLKILSHPVV